MIDLAQKQEQQEQQVVQRLSRWAPSRCDIKHVLFTLPCEHKQTFNGSINV